MLLPTLTGILLAASFPRSDQGCLAWIAFIPLLLFLLDTGTITRAFCGGFAAGAVQCFILLPWMRTVLMNYGGMHKILAWLIYGLAVAVIACFPGIACALTKFLMRHLGVSTFLLFPATWVCLEYVQSFFPFGGFPWLLVGYSQTRYLTIIQAADLVGVYGITFLILWTNCALAWAIWSKGRALRRSVPMISAVLLSAGCIVYGKGAMNNWAKVKREFRAVMLQADLDIDQPAEILIDKLRTGYLSMAESLAEERYDLLILPESPTPVSFPHDAAYREALEKLARRYELGLVFNNISYTGKHGRERYYNSAVFMTPGGSIAGIYHKIHLVPFGEYLPLRKIFSSFAQTITRDVGEFSSGEEHLVVGMKGHTANAIICFEAVFPGLVRRFVQHGSQLIINLTNDRWYGNSSAPYQHLAIARWRAIENRRYLLRAANSGVTAVIEPTGRIQVATQILQEAVCIGGFAFLQRQTFYTRYGDVFVLLCAIIIFVVFAFASFRIIALRRNECSRNCTKE